MENELVLREVRIFKHVTITRTKNKGALDTNDKFKYSNTRVKWIILILVKKKKKKKNCKAERYSIKCSTVFASVSPEFQICIDHERPSFDRNFFSL